MSREVVCFKAFYRPLSARRLPLCMRKIPSSAAASSWGGTDSDAENTSTSTIRYPNSFKVFAVHHRPVQGTRGVYRVNLRHGVSRVRSGQRHTVGIIFHDAN